MPASRDLIDLTGCAAVAALKREEVSPLELLDAVEARIAEVEPQVNALPTLCFDRARDRAKKLLAKPVAERGLLAGLPLPIKDLTEVEGVRTCFGSPIFAGNIPTRSNIIVHTIESQGGVVFGKSAVPEFGAGGHTFNDVFGMTYNPWDRSKSAAGSSGGAAVSLATGMAWIAHGNDLGGSLRTPASFCGVVGFRPSPGRIARDPGVTVGSLLGAEGPMARTIADAALFLDALSGEDARDPISLPRLPQSFLTAAQAPRKPRKVAFSVDLGITPVDSEVAAICRAAAEKLSREGVIVEEAHPDLTEAHEAFQVLRAHFFAASHGPKLRDYPHLLKPEMIWNVEKGLCLTIPELLKAEAQRAELITRTFAFFDKYDLLLTPAAIVPPFPNELRYVEECGGKRFETYMDWLAIAYAITLTTAPALSMPCGFTASGLPVGMQVVARPRGELNQLAYAAFMEPVFNAAIKQPINPS